MLNRSHPCLINISAPVECCSYYGYFLCADMRWRGECYVVCSPWCVDLAFGKLIGHNNKIYYTFTIACAEKEKINNVAGIIFFMVVLYCDVNNAALLGSAIKKL
jgi:hypothetical protein